MNTGIGLKRQFYFHFQENPMNRFNCFMQNFLFIIMFLLIPISLKAAETGKIAGIVLEKSSGEALIGASVYIKATWQNDEEIEIDIPQGAAADEDGYYFILNVRPGLYTLVCSFVGYKDNIIIKVPVYIDKTTEIYFDMLPELLETEAVVVTAYQPNKVEKDLTATKQTYNIAEVEQIAGVVDIADIIELQADVVDNHFRGGREGESLYLISGGSINNPLNSSKSFDPMVAALQEVEVFTSGFSAEFGNAQSGVINMVPKVGGEKWTSRIDYSLDLPHDQLWGGNPYSIENMPFFSKLSNPEEWLKTYIEDEQEKQLIRYWTDFIPEASHYNNISDPDLRLQIMRKDSLRAAQIAAYNWRQMARYVGMDYTGITPYRIDITTGGPLSNKLKLFVAVSQSEKNAVVPTTQPDLKRQWMNNLSYQLNPKDKILFSYHYSYSFKNTVGGPTNWFDTVIHNVKTIKNDQQFGIKWNHVFNPSSYMDVAVRLLSTDQDKRPDFLEGDRFISNAFNGNSTNNTYAGRYDNTPTGHRASNLSTSRGFEKTKTYSFDGSYVRQLNKSNLLKAGFQFHTYDIDVNQQFNLTSPGEHTYIKYTVKPYEGAFYIQNKMEFEDFIANIGLRYDFYNFNYNYYSNLYTPLFNPYFPDEGQARDADYARKEKTDVFGRLQPRLGISFPVSEDMVFHLNYGTFIQRPGFDYILRTKLTSRGEINEIGNARLKPEKTSAWDIGIVHALPLGFRLDISAYFKDVNDLTEQAVYVNSGNEAYINYINRDYANIKGFHVNLERVSNILNFYIRYNYQTAKGKASSPGGALVTLYETPLGDGTTVDLPDPRDIYMDYDRTHRFVANTRWHTSSDGGPEIFEIKPFTNVSVSATFKYQSGRPYTDDEKLLGLVLNKRMPAFYDLKIRIQKTFRVGGYSFTPYLEGFNILNNKEYSRKIFTDKAMLQRWKRGDRDELVWYDGTFEEDPKETRELFQYNDAYSIYDNEPRYFRLGLRIQM